MDPRPSKPSAKSATPRTPGDTVPTQGTLVEPPCEWSAGAVPFFAPPEKPDEIGRLGSYRVLAELGRGGMGVVYRAEDQRLARTVALKVLLPELAADPRAKTRFVREARAQARVEHDHIIPIFAVEEANGVAFIVMPLLKGQTLSAALKINSRPPLTELVRIGREIAQGLAAAHGADLIHRDIKPGNIWLEGKQRRVKILDFGLARSVAPAAGGVDGGAEPPTVSGTMMGTPAYMAPEQARSRPTDHRTDLFSLGAVLYQMATGTMPFTGPSTFDVMAAVVAYDPPPVCEVVPDVPSALSEVIQRLMAKDPAGRPESAESVAEELDAIARGPVAVPVQVVPLGAVPGAPDPWADLDTTEVRDGDGDEDDPGATVVMNRRAARSPTPKWLWPAVAGACALALVVGALAATKPWKGKKRIESANDPPLAAPITPVPKVAPTVTPDRRAAEWALNIGKGFSTLVVIRQDGAEREVHPGHALPSGSWALVQVHLNDNPNLTDDSLAMLKGCTELSHLSLHHTNIGNAGLAHLKELTALTFVNLNSTKVTGAGLAQLKNCRTLRKLFLDGTTFGDADFESCKPLPSLNYLDLTNTQVTAEGANKFVEAVPDCRVDWNGGQVVGRGADGAPVGPTGGLAFDGKSTLVKVPALAFDGAVPLTIEAWITPETVRESHIILLGQPGGGIGLSKDGAFGAGFFDGSGWQSDYSKVKLKAGETVHVAAVMTKDRIALFVDGRAVGTKGVNLGTLPATRAPGLIGKNTPGSPESYFHGTVHAIHVSHGARYDKSFTPPIRFEENTNTLVLYRFEEGAGTKLTDRSSNKWHGAIENGIWVAPKKP